MSDEFEYQILKYQQEQDALERLQQQQREIATQLQLKQLLEQIRSHFWNGQGEIVEKTKGWGHEGSEGATAEYELALVYPFFEDMEEVREYSNDVDTAGNTGYSISYSPVIRQPGISLHINRSQSEEDFGFSHSLRLRYTPDPHKAPYTSDEQDPLKIFDNSLYADVFGYNTSESEYFDYRKPEDIQKFTKTLIEIGASISPQKLGLPKQFHAQILQPERRNWFQRLLD